MKKFICLFSVIISCAITAYYIHFEGITGNASALSKVGLEHKGLFVLWGISTYFALAFNICTAFQRTKYRFYIPALIISMIGMALTLLCDFDYGNYPQYLAHCIGSLTFSAVTGILIVCLFICLKRRIFAALCSVILLADLILLIIFKETALIETVPVFAGYAMLLATNLKKDKNEITQKIK